MLMLTLSILKKDKLMIDMVLSKIELHSIVPNISNSIEMAMNNFSNYLEPFLGLDSGLITIEEQIFNSMIFFI